MVIVGLSLTIKSQFADSRLLSEGIAFIIVGFVGMLMSWTTMDVGASIKEAIYDVGRQQTNALESLALAFKETALAFKEVSLAFKETSLAFKETSLAFKETSLAFKETSLAFKETSLAFKETSSAFKETSLAFKETASSQKEIKDILQNKD